MKVELLGIIKKFDSVENEITIKFSFLPPEQQLEIEELVNTNKLGKFFFNSLKNRLRSYKQLKQLWVDIGKIILALKKKEGVETLYITAEEKQALYDYVKENLFPAKFIELGDERLPCIPSSKDIEMQDMAMVIGKLREKYEYLNIDWGR
jgi:hypothetical protein